MAGFEPFPRRFELAEVCFVLGDCASPPLELHRGWGWATLFVFEWMVLAERLSGLTAEEFSSIVLVSRRGRPNRCANISTRPIMFGHFLRSCSVIGFEPLGSVPYLHFLACAPRILARRLGYFVPVDLANRLAAAFWLGLSALGFPRALGLAFS